MRALITGASGFAGGWLCRACLQAGDEVHGISRSGTAPEGASAAPVDLRDSDAIAACVRAFAPEVVYHLAAEVGGIGANRANPGRYWYANLMMGAHVLELSREHGVSKLILAGTVCA